MNFNIYSKTTRVWGSVVITLILYVVVHRIIGDSSDPHLYFTWVEQLAIAPFLLPIFVLPLLALSGYSIYQLLTPKEERPTTSTLLKTLLFLLSLSLIGVWYYNLF